MNEARYQSLLIKTLKTRFPGCIIVRNDPVRYPGFPDITIYYEDKYAWLEVKISEDAPQQPNQEFYIDKFNKMSFAAFIYPENEEEVLNELQRSFDADR